MDKKNITNIIENFAPLELQEKWDCSGWLIDSEKTEINKILLCLTITQDIINQAETQNCDMIISHHPLFFVPIKWKNINIYCAHTNMDRTNGGTTDTLISNLNLEQYIIASDSKEIQPFLRYVKYKTSVKEFIEKLKTISPNLRYVNNNNITEIKKIAFCAGSGSDLIQEAHKNGADAIVTGDLKFHTAIESPIIVFDIGHFESEIMILEVFEKLLTNNVECIKAKEKSPFITIL